MKKNILKISTFIIISIALGCYFTYSIYQYFNDSPIVSTSLEINHYRLLGLLCVCFLMTMIKINPDKKQRKWQYLLSILIFIVSYNYILNDCPYFNTGLDRKDAILMKNLYLIYIPAVSVMTISFFGEYLPIGEKYKKIGWCLIYFLMLVIQIDIIQSFSQYASQAPDLHAIFTNHNFIRNIWITHVLLISVSFMMNIKFDRSFITLLSIIVVGYAIVCLTAHFSLNLDMKGMKYDFILCQLIPLISVMLSAAIQSISHKQMRCLTNYASRMTPKKY